MIVDTDMLPSLQGQVAMVDGGFDPIHDGHVRYFAEAANLGHPVLCNICADSWIERKHAPLLPRAQRTEVIDAFRHIDYVHLSQHASADILRMLKPRLYVKGSDWRDRLPIAERTACDEFGIEIIYVDTVTNSSSRLLAGYLRRQASGRLTW